MEGGFIIVRQINTTVLVLVKGADMNQREVKQVFKC